MYNNRLDLYLLELLQRCDPEDVDKVISTYNRQSGSNKGGQVPEQLWCVDPPRKRQELVCLSEEECNPPCRRFKVPESYYQARMVDPRTWLRVPQWWNPKAKIETKVDSIAMPISSAVVSTVHIASNSITTAKLATVDSKITVRQP